MDFQWTHTWLQWLEDNSFWPIWAVLWVGIITAMIIWKVRPIITYIEFGKTRSVQRSTDNKIQIDGEIMVTAPKTSVKCSGVLRIGKTIIELTEIPLMINEISQKNTREVLLEGQYIGAYAGQALLKLKVELGNKKRKCFKTPIQLSILEKIDKTPKPPYIPRMGFHG